MSNPTVKPKLTEAHIQKAVVDFLILDGWRAIRTDPVSDRSRGKGFGEVGMPDYLFIRYDRYGVYPDNILWIEFKAPGKVPTRAQLAWHKAEQARGGVIKVVDSIDQFTTWYITSALVWRLAPPLAKAITTFTQ
jgi:hypothetical protein